MLSLRAHDVECHTETETVVDIVGACYDDGDCAGVANQMFHLHVLDVAWDIGSAVEKHTLMAYDVAQGVAVWLQTDQGVVHHHCSDPGTVVDGARRGSCLHIWSYC